MSEAADKFIARMLVVYGQPDTADDEMFVAEYKRILSNYPADVLDAAVVRLLKTRKYRTWPTIADCVTVAEAVCADKAREQKAPIIAGEARRKAELVEAVMRSEMAKTAAREGWILGLKGFVETHNRRPRDYEIFDIKETSEFVAKCAAGAVDMGVAHQALLKLANAMLARREKLAKQVLGESDHA